MTPLTLLLLPFLQSVVAEIGSCKNNQEYGINNPASLQIVQFKEKHPIRPNFTTSFGTPVSHPGTALTAGPKGPIMISDIPLMKRLMQMNRERIPERVVHAKGAGAYGKLEITSTEITKYCKADVFSELGKITKLFVRFSTVNGEAGSPDTIRSFRGFAMKCYTKEGNWDLVGLNSKIFFIREAPSFPDLTHVTKRNPVTHIMDATMRWDFFSLMPESTFALMVINSPRGIPKNFRYMNGHGINTFTLFDDKGDFVFCKFHMISNQGIKNLEPEEALRLAGCDPDNNVRDLRNSIDKGWYPSWNMSVQIMTQKQAQRVIYNHLDPTKIWPEEDFPLIPVGVITLNRNPKNFFAEVEQAAFCPSRMPPGIGPSNDKLLQGRFLSYLDTQNYRLETNHEQLPVNRPYVKVANTERDGAASVDGNQDGSPNYFPSSFNGPRPDPRGKTPPFPVSGNIGQYDTRYDDNFSQPAKYWKGLSEADRKAIVTNIAGSLSTTPPSVQKAALGNFMKVNETFGKQLFEKLTERAVSP